MKKRKHTEQLLIDTSQFVVSIDTKWRSDLPPLAPPREEDLYCLGIVKKEKDSSSIATLRDLRGKHIPMLNNLQKDGLAVIEKIYGIQSDQIRCYFHYQPQFYHFRVLFTRLENKIGAAVERGQLLIDIIQNLDLFSENVSLRIGQLVSQIW